MKKKIYLFILVAFALGTIIFLLNNSYAIDSNENWYEDFTYVLDTSNMEINLQKYNGTNEEVTIYPKVTIDSNEYTVSITGITMAPTRYTLFSSNANITKVIIEDGVKVKDNLNSLFYNCTNLEEVTIKGLDATDLVSMRFAFYNCQKLTSIDLSHLRLNNGTVTEDKMIDLEGLFSTCSNLTNITLGSSFDTKNVYSMAKMFIRCTSLVNIDLSNLNTANVKDMSYMFYYCNALTNITFGNNFNTSNVTNMSYMFGRCSNIENIDLSNFNTINVKTMNNMFEYCEKVTEIVFDANFNTSNVTNMSNMFRNCTKLKKLDLSRFNTFKVTTIRSMFQECSALRELNIQNFDTTNITDMYYFLYNVSVNKITFGSKFDFKFNETLNSYPFGRGIWKKNDNTLVNAVDVVLESSRGDISGTYTKVSNIVDEMNINYPVTYRIEKISKIDEFSTTNSNTFYLDDNYVYVKNLLPNSQSATDEGYTLDGSVTLLFKDAVTNSDGEKFNLQMKIDNVRIYDINEDEANGESFIGYIARLNTATKVISLYDVFQTNDKSKTIYQHSAVKQDVTFKILDASGNVMDGSFLFSVADIDIPSKRDLGNLPAHTDADGNVIFGYGDYSEGVNLISGYDFDTLQVYPETKLVINNGTHRIFGKHADAGTEFTEFSIKANASGLKFTWTAGINCGTQLMANYQPQVVSIGKVDVNNEYISGAKLELYKGDDTTPINTWTTINEAEKIFLTPGRYTLKEVLVPDGYKKANNLVFYVDINDKLTVEGVSVSSINLKDDYNKYQYTVNYYDYDTKEMIHESKTSEADYRSTITALAENDLVELPSYTYYQATDKDENKVDNITIEYNKENILNLYYKRNMIPVTIKHVDYETNEEIIDSETLNLPEGENYDLEDKYHNLESMNYYYEKSSDNVKGIVTDGIEIIHYYRRKYDIRVRVRGIGGTITGNEKVLEGNDSAEGAIKIVAEDNYCIKSITINGESIDISDQYEMTLPNFKDVHQDHEIIVEFESTIVPDIPKTDRNSKLMIYGIFCLITGLAITMTYYLKKKNG